MRTSRLRTARLRTVHPLLWAGTAALAVGAVLCVIGWYGASGERFAERQIPYLASCTVPGAALIVAGAVLLVGSRGALATARVQELYELLVAADPGAPASPPAAPGPRSDALVLVPGGTLYHRADCPLVAGKPEAVPADPHPGLTPCPVCEPPTPGHAAEPEPEPEPERKPEPMSGPDKADPEP
ncbi:hypothetical protein [Streptomyces cavernicola]|uniref:Uncharacterized protein n=1 Tax=Streptomyces cavernicola TaxID=3043613 RepID=A0ABT6SH27_9ACTN|nr:hypothetical protein [Streptomyces sp. B-S-A6]MDI3407309.1 hypothetical protein [Streptomyces sp. B-S-A6]